MTLYIRFLLEGYLPWHYVLVTVLVKISTKFHRMISKGVQCVLLKSFYSYLSLELESVRLSLSYYSTTSTLFCHISIKLQGNDQYDNLQSVFVVTRI